jgi:transcriptional regulator with XRE-family HTH domain
VTHDEHTDGTLADAIRKARKEAALRPAEKQKRTPRQKGWLTQAELAARVGVDRGVVNKWESGKRGINEPHAVQLATELDKPRDYFLRFIPARPSRAELAAFRERLEAVEDQMKTIREQVEAILKRLR